MQAQNATAYATPSASAYPTQMRPCQTASQPKLWRSKKKPRMPAIEIHAHDDFGNAVENTMAAIKAAARRLGQSLRQHHFSWVSVNVQATLKPKKFSSTSICIMASRNSRAKPQKLKATADFIGKATGYVVPPNKAIVGDYGFAHESGIHTHGVLNDPWTYEPYPPELVGNTRRLTIGKQSGKGIIKHKITELSGNEPDDETVATVVETVKDIYANGRRASLKEEEFKKILRILKVLPETNGNGRC